MTGEQWEAEREQDQKNDKIALIVFMCAIGLIVIALLLMLVVHIREYMYYDAMLKALRQVP